MPHAQLGFHLQRPLMRPVAGVYRYQFYEVQELGVNKNNPEVAAEFSSKQVEDR